MESLAQEIPARTTKVFGTPGKFQKTREIIPVPEGMTRPCEVARYFGCHKATARNVLKQGYYIVDYMKKTTSPGQLVMTPEECYKLAWKVYRMCFQDRFPWYVDPEEAVQEAIVGLMEQAGNPKFEERRFRFYVAKNYMNKFYRKVAGCRKNNINIDKDELIMYVDPSVDTWAKKNAQEDLLINLIDQKAA
jgi:hypothetical protein